ncbi:HNH endonuclease signature motif containing protein [Streptomyces olivoreticuli]|uniref:HNH endonuclease signature motif containing protein n=1 Tax=Streptomyces olivoreticuli TaxID=68246 RepID=UPI002658ABC8|nr:HNH endonuclease signature motif containing protein [Streptomyces olivoreticuli]WKK21713.1 HNH endonuclease signature motif containing protein [Streptomyces olivoreticuli]
MPVSPYTRERLAEAARSSRTLSEALEKLGVDPKSSRRRYVFERMKRLGVETSHFEREGVRWTREVLEAAVAKSVSVNGVLRHLGIEVVGGHHAHISRRIRSFGIDTSHFRPPTRTGASMGTRRRSTPQELLVRQNPANARRVPSERLKRAMLALGTPECCGQCGIAEWCGQPLPLEVDHVDGDWHNNCFENLRLLCPNCHSATDTYRGRAKGRRRRSAQTHGTEGAA